MTSESQSRYRAKITQTPISETPPSQAMPARLEHNDWQPGQVRSGPSLGFVTLLTGGLFAFAYGVFQALSALVASFDSFPVLTSILGALLFAFVACLVALIGREVSGYRQVSKYMKPAVALTELQQEPDPRQMVKALQVYGRRFSRGSYAAACYARFSQSLNEDMSAAEIHALYLRNVQQAVEKRASEVLRKESMVAGSMSFISPNHLIQTLVIVWTSLRTIRRVAYVFGLRPATVGNWKLLRVLAQNLAAQSIFDLATDEITNQISGSLSARFVENSAEAVAAGALNVRLGKALIRLLRD